MHVDGRLLFVAALLLASMGFRYAHAQDAQPRQVAEGIYMITGIHEQMALSNQGAIANSGFIVGSQSVAVIDPGGSLAAGKRLAQAVKLVTDLPVRYVVLSHFHPDHVAGLNAFPEASHTIAHEKYNRALVQRAEFYLDRFEHVLGSDSESVFKPVTDSVRAAKKREIDLGDRLLSIEAHPVAHTDNDVTVHDIDTNTLWASDLVFAQRTPSLDGSLNGWIDVMEQLRSRSFDLVIPGHGSPGKWDATTNPQNQYLLTLRDDMRETVARGVALSTVLQQHDSNPETVPQWALYPEQHGSNLAKAYTEIEWE